MTDEEDYKISKTKEKRLIRCIRLLKGNDQDKICGIKSLHALLGRLHSNLREEKKAIDTFQENESDENFNSYSDLAWNLLEYFDRNSKIVKRIVDATKTINNRLSGGKNDLTTPEEKSFFQGLGRDLDRHKNFISWRYKKHGRR